MRIRSSYVYNFYKQYLPHYFFTNDNKRFYTFKYVGKPWTVIGRAASLYTDLFIMLSGLLTTYAFVGRLKKTGNLDVKKEYLSRLMRSGFFSLFTNK